jgi:hypothetical protein
MGHLTDHPSMASPLFKHYTRALYAASSSSSSSSSASSASLSLSHLMVVQYDAKKQTALLSMKPLLLAAQVANGQYVFPSFICFRICQRIIAAPSCTPVHVYSHA